MGLIKRNKNGKRLLIAADCKIDEVFVDTFEGELGLKVDVFFIDSTGRKRMRAGGRHIGYLLTSINSIFYRRSL